MNLGVLITSYDGYADVWPIAAELLKRFWSDRQWPLYWMTNGKPVPDIAQPIHTPPIPREEWGNNIAAAVACIDAPFIFYWPEEVLLMSAVPTEMVSEAIALMEANPHVGIVQMTRYYWRPDNPTIGNFRDYQQGQVGFAAALPAIYRKEVLLYLLRALPQSNDFEQQSTRIMASDLPAVRSLAPCKPMFKFCDNALLKGPWRPCGVKHLEDLGFKVDISQRGVAPDGCRFMDGVPA